MQDSPTTILHSALRFFSGTMLSRVSGLMRDVAMAYAFGTQGSVAALLVAFRFAHLLRRLFGEGALQTSFIPHFEEFRTSNLQRAGRFFRDLTLSLTYLLGLIIIGIVILLGCVTVYGHLSTGNEEILWLTLLMMPSLLFICLFGLNASLLQCEKNYFASSAAPVVFNVIWTIGVFCVSGLFPSNAMSWLAGFIVFACFAQWVVTVPKTYAILKSCRLNSLWKDARFFSEDVKSLIKPLTLGIVGVTASQINNAFDAIFARWASEDGPAVLWYAIRLQQLPLALFGIALSGALLPPLARAVKNHDLSKYRLFLHFAIQRSITLMLPISLGLLVMGDCCINVIYGRGDFMDASIVETTWGLWGYTIGLIPMTLILVLAPAFYAKGDYRTPSTAAVASMGINLVLNALMIGGFAFGPGSVALATSISSWVNLIWLGTVISKNNEPFFSRILMSSLGKISFCAISAGLAVLAIDMAIWKTSSAIAVAQGAIPLYDRHLLLQLLHLGINALTFAVVLMGTAFIFKIDELKSLVSKKGWHAITN